VNSGFCICDSTAADVSLGLIRGLDDEDDDDEFGVCMTHLDYR
jgi:hypothetical protein